MLTKENIKKGLYDLGINKGNIVLVHSALSSIGEVDGGADTLITALLEVVGEEGTIVMPTICFENIFDIKNSRSTVGKVTEIFRTQYNTIRSLHPIHSVAAKGKYAVEITKDHIKATESCGKDTPYDKIAQLDGYILLFGCDQDRNTTLHTVEAFADAPYLSTIEAKYYDENGEIKIKKIEKFPGPHRDFIKVDKLLREAGIMKIGKIGKAVCRLIKAKEMIEFCVQEMKKNPYLMLCENYNCLDCTKQSGKIKKAILAKEDFVLSGVSDELGRNIDEIILSLQSQGMEYVELRKIGTKSILEITDTEIINIVEKFRKTNIKVSAIGYRNDRFDIEKQIELAKLFNANYIILPIFEVIPQIIEKNGVSVLVENTFQKMKDCIEILQKLPSSIKLAFNSANFIKAGEKNPFHMYTRTRIKKYIGQLYLTDYTFNGEYQLLGQGNGEIKELISILRCSSFDGFFTFNMCLSKDSLTFRKSALSFWKLFETM